jgi:dCTP deaminase
MLLSRPAILRYLQSGDIVISPYNEAHLSTASYDVTLGPWYYRELAQYGSNVYNPYDEQHVRRVWGTEPSHATPLKDTAEFKDLQLSGIAPTDEVIIIHPGETILAHTNEYIGGAGDKVCTMMKARSSMGRNFIEVCKCAGWGDIPYFNRWTMEITNNSRNYAIPLVVGRRIAQIVFFEAEPITDGRDYTAKGKYQSARTLAELEASWTPKQMLPRMYLDFEARKARGEI